MRRVRIPLFGDRDLIQTLGPPLASACIATLVFLYLWYQDRESHLAIWAGAWALWVVRYVVGLSTDAVALDPADPVLPLLAIARGGMMLWGTYELLRRSMPRGWIALFAADALVVLVEFGTGAPVGLPGSAGQLHYVVFAVALLWSGVLLWTGYGLPRLESRVTGAALVFNGVLQVTYPLLEALPTWYTEWAYVVMFALQTLIPIGILMAYLRRAANEVQALDLQLQGALTQALAEHVPICAHCKSVREEGEWVRVERYVSNRTAATFSHSICPTCEETHYGEVV